MILIALGSNVGNREAMLAQAREVLPMFDVSVVAESRLYETPALMPEGAPKDWDIPFLNQVIAVETHLAPRALLAVLKHIEADLGRKPSARWAPREIDLDLLAYDEAILADDFLTLPHPEMDQRRFVLEPLCDIAPDWVHPVLGLTARALLEGLER